MHRIRRPGPRRGPNGTPYSLSSDVNDDVINMVQPERCRQALLPFLAPFNFLSFVIMDYVIEEDTLTDTPPDRNQRPRSVTEEHRIREWIYWFKEQRRSERRWKSQGSELAHQRQRINRAYIAASELKRGQRRAFNDVRERWCRWYEDQQLWWSQKQDSVTFWETRDWISTQSPHHSASDADDEDDDEEQKHDDLANDSGADVVDEPMIRTANVDAHVADAVVMRYRSEIEAALNSDHADETAEYDDITLDDWDAADDDLCEWDDDDRMQSSEVHADVLAFLDEDVAEAIDVD